MDIGRIEGAGGPSRIEPQHLQPVRPAEVPPPTLADRADITEIPRLSTEAAALPAVRMDRVEEFRQLIASGQYQTDERLLGAFQKFIRENFEVR